jgi:hypothetical protein
MITESFIGVDQEVLLNVFKSWINRLKWMIKHEGKYHTKSREKRNISLRLAEKAGGQELMDPYILWGASAGQRNFFSAVT